MFYFSKCSLLLHVFIILNGLELQKQSVFAKIISLAHWIIAKWNYYYDVKYPQQMLNIESTDPSIEYGDEYSFF